MTWVRGSDTMAMHPIPLAILEHEDFDDRLVNELFGFFIRCAAQSAAHMTDYVVSFGTAAQMAGPSRVAVLIEYALWAGYFTDQLVDDDGRRSFKLVADPEFVHLRLKQEVEWENARRRHNANPALVIPVRFRDGDACRYCLRVVDWAARKGALRGTYDHRVPGDMEPSVDTMVVACLGCNSSRGADMDKLRLMPEPEEPYYSPHTVEWFDRNEWARRNHYVLPDRARRKRKPVKPGDFVPGTQPAHCEKTIDSPTTELDPRSTSQVENASQRSGSQPESAPERSASQVENATLRTDPRSANAHPSPELSSSPRQQKPGLTSADGVSAGLSRTSRSQGFVSGRVGSGRDWSGLVGSGGGSVHGPVSGARSGRSRGRRRGRDPG